MKLKIKDLAIVCFLITSCFTFILEDMIYTGSANSYSVSAGIMLFFLLTSVLILGKSAKGIIEYSWIWIFYIVTVMISLLRRNFLKTALCDVMIIIVALFGVMIINQSIERFKTGIRFLCIMGLINTFAIFLQYILGETYNKFYWSLLTEKWKEYAKYYFDKGYYMGIQAVPGQAAGAIIFALGIIVCYILLAKYEKERIKHKGICFLSIIGMILAILLTGKKGIFISGILAIFILFITLLAQKKQWIRLLLLLLAVVIGYNVFKWYVLQHANVAFLYRFSQFFKAMEEGNQYAITTGRSYLYVYAIELWKNHMLLGIGWRTFRDYTVYLYGYESKHDVNLDYLQMLCECGILGFVMIMIPVLITLFRTLKLERSILKSSMNFSTKFTIMVAGFIQLFTLIYAFFEIPFYDRTFFVVYAFSCIIINNAYREYGKKGMIAYAD